MFRFDFIVGGGQRRFDRGNAWPECRRSIWVWRSTWRRKRTGPPQHCEGVSAEVSEGLVAVAERWVAEVRSVLWSLLRPARQAARLIMVRRLQDRVQALRRDRD
jgi:hypothetical protein